MAALGLHCFAWAFSSCGEGGTFLAVGGLLLAVASLAEGIGPRLSGLSLQHAGSVAVTPGLRVLCRRWDLPRPGIEPGSPALAGGFLSTVPPGKSEGSVLVCPALLVFPSLEVPGTNQ